MLGINCLILLGFSLEAGNTSYEEAALAWEVSARARGLR